MLIQRPRRVNQNDRPREFEARTEMVSRKFGNFDHGT